MPDTASTGPPTTTGGADRLETSVLAVADRIGPLDEASMAAVRANLDRMAKPPGSLGRLEEMVAWLAGVTGDVAAAVRPARIVVAAADHGIVAQGVSAWPQAVTGQMVATYLAGGAAINVLAGWAGASVTIVDAGLAAPLPPPVSPGAGDPRVDLVVAPIRRGGTADFSTAPAMTRSEAATAVRLGLDVARRLAGDGVRVVGLGDMGIGNTTAASAITSVMTGRPVAEVTGSGAGADEAALRRKVERIGVALRTHRPVPTDPIGVLAAIGGFEIGCLVGVILGAAADRIPVVLDGFITGAAALVAAGLAADLPPRLLAAHRSAEPGHLAALASLGLRPMLDLDMRLGEGTGSALVLGLLDAACRVRDRMATFDAAGVSGPA